MGGGDVARAKSAGRSITGHRTNTWLNLAVQYIVERLITDLHNARVITQHSSGSKYLVFAVYSSGELGAC